MRKLFVKEIKGNKIQWWDIIEDKLFYNSFCIFLRHLYRFIKRLIIWLPLCWNTESWDFEGYYDFIEMFMKEQLKDQERDEIHLESDVRKRIRQIRICLAYLDRYRNWPNYYDYPESILVENDNPKYGKTYSIKYKRGDDIRAKEACLYEEFNRKMFWKRFLQWHQGWWT